MGPAAIGLSATQLNVVINSWLASLLGTGAVSWLAYAFRVVFVPIGLFGVALATVSLPKLSRESSEGDLESLKQTLSRALRLAVALSIPAAAGLIVLSRPLTAAIYEHGKFTAFDTVQTANALIAFSVGLAAYSGVKVLVPAFYALGDTKTPLMRYLGHVGLALSVGLTAIFNFVQLWLWLGRKIGPLPTAEVVRTLFRSTVASALMAGVLGIGLYFSRGWWEAELAGKITVLILSVPIGAAVVIFLYRVFGVEEWKEMRAALFAITSRLGLRRRS
jgi:putative peptidoglycan lipid II flippase